ncbi:unnamed protein product, partial [Pylaiella littoralis]
FCRSTPPREPHSPAILRQRGSAAQLATRRLFFYREGHLRLGTHGPRCECTMAGMVEVSSAFICSAGAGSGAGSSAASTTSGTTATAAATAAAVSIESGTTASTAAAASAASAAVLALLLYCCAADPTRVLTGSSSRPLRHAAAGRGLVAASWQRLTHGGVGADAGGAVNEECATRIQPPHPSSLLTTHAHTRVVEFICGACV